ncbi:MAG: hypothetical protein ABIR62_08900, partial [Dokdonella sp.]|uniref:DUF7507 domain-containing protein n=1 Tax=Dokdonella sp. TaxID=2291710 RepID=UPI003264B305
GQVITCALPAGIAVGGSISYTIPVTPQASADGQNVSNTATGNNGGDPSCPSADHCNDTVTNTVTAPQLQLIKTATPSPFVVGQPATYTLTLTNIGTAPTTAITTIADTVPSGLTLGTLPTDCSATGQQVTCTVAAGLATGAPVSFTIPVTPTDTLNGQSVTNAAGATGGGDPGCPAGMPIADLPARCRHDVTTPVNAPQLTLVKTASAAAFVVDVPASYALQVTNTGSASTTAAATITDVVPAGLTLGTLPTGCSASGQQVDCTIAAGLAAGASVTFVIPVTPTLAATPSVSNTATVAGGGDPTCPKTANCSSTVKTPVGAPALQLVKTASDAAFVVGVPASYLLTVTNIGTTATTADAAVIDNVPGNLVIGTLSPGCVAAGQQVTCTVLGGLAPGASTSFTIAVTPSAAASGSTLTNTATVAGGGDPTCPGKGNPNCISTVDTPVGAPALQIVKTASDRNFVVGVPASYTLTVTNVGAAATTAAATISDNVPTGLPLGAVSTGCSVTGQQVTCTIAAGLAAGASTSFLIAVTPLADASGTTLSNTATVAGGGDPSCPAGALCSSTVMTPVDAPALTLVKTASDGGFAVGVPASYTLTVTNTGNAATTAAAVVIDNVPSTLTLGVLPSGCTAAGQQVSCIVAAGLAAGASTSFTLPVTPMASAAGTTLTNTATVSGGGDPRCPAATQCSSTVTTPIDAPVLTIQKTASDASFVVGLPASYALTVTNSGTVATSAEAVVTDDVPAALDIGALPGGCASVGQQIACTIPAGLAAGASVVFTIEVTPTAAASGTTLSNTAGVSGGGDPACPAAARCSSTVATPVNAPLLTIVKSGPASAVPGGSIVYAITVTNAGTAVATHAVLGDVPPAGLTFVSADAPCSSGFPCDLGDLLPGQTITVATTFAIAPSFNGSLVNQASVTSDQTVQISSTATTIVPVTPGGETIQSVPVDARWMLSLMVLLMLGGGLGRVRTRD